MKALDKIKAKFGALWCVLTNQNYYMVKVSEKHGVRKNNFYMSGKMSYKTALISMHLYSQSESSHVFKEGATLGQILEAFGSFTLYKTSDIKKSKTAKPTFSWSKGALYCNDKHYKYLKSLQGRDQVSKASKLVCKVIS